MSKRLRSSEVCADCSVPAAVDIGTVAERHKSTGNTDLRSKKDPRWASVNRGVLICDECCSVHRSLGRHSSQVRHLTHTPWPATQLQMVQTLYGNGANSIWEHSLLDPASIMSGKRKANPQDKVHPNKAEFIRAKYQMLAFVHRMPCREEDSVTAKDLSKQLHSSVRTGNLETCLRLLSLGAQANFFHPEKGNTPLHVAAKAGQILQAELLTVYGADPGAPDASGKTPIDCARQAGHQDLGDRLVEIQYELTDRLAFYLCGRKPDHKSGQHFIIPQMADSSLDLSELAKAAKKKLQSLSNHLFEELAMDVYDEVDRRETDAVWLATQNHSTLVTETTVVPFLPVNPEYSSTRNQGRQKLARFNAHEFATLVIDILSDAKRRQLGSSVSSPKENVELILKNIGSRHGSESQDNDQPDYDSVASDEDTELEPSSVKTNRAKSVDSDLSDGPITVQEFMEVKNALTASEAKIHQLMKVNSNLSDELRLMQKKASKLEKQSSMPDSDYDNTPNDSELDDTGCNRKGKLRTSGWHGEGSIPELEQDPEAEPDSTLPSTEDVIRKTEQITKNIQELLRAAQEDKHDRPNERESLRKLRHSLGCFSTLVPWADKTPSLHSLSLHQPDSASCFIPCSERIHIAVTEMAALFPKKPRSEMVRTSLRLLTSSAYRLQSECKKTLPVESGPDADMQLVTQQVIQCAYDIAKAAKQLVTITTKENSN
ncbi:ARF GTPase-activating protein GIT2-like isoform X11 [Acipenser ruthenus]|uniref:ARF GTPase-activating protein GIT2-like isoform X11 n=1 Tax=Acipenser ruthenus TaxID=7906 RepID=UPI002741181B|nr:ARF GTPase-activating protein GIT2-like isoform X11 [Acipenser ruthenus]XP_058888937.1 ARF GTPase-activating protein GIT2-like isoform X11 [Acipenser ruthenus]